MRRRSCRRTRAYTVGGGAAAARGEDGDSEGGAGGAPPPPAHTHTHILHTGRTSGPGWARAHAADPCQARSTRSAMGAGKALSRLSNRARCTRVDWASGGWVATRSHAPCLPGAAGTACLHAPWPHHLGYGFSSPTHTPPRMNRASITSPRAPRSPADIRPSQAAPPRPPAPFLPQSGLPAPRCIRVGPVRRPHPHATSHSPPFRRAPTYGRGVDGPVPGVRACAKGGVKGHWERREEQCGREARPIHGDDDRRPGPHPSRQRRRSTRAVQLNLPPPPRRRGQGRRKGHSAGRGRRKWQCRRAGLDG